MTDIFVVRFKFLSYPPSPLLVSSWLGKGERGMVLYKYLSGLTFRHIQHFQHWRGFQPSSIQHFAVTDPTFCCQDWDSPPKPKGAAATSQSSCSHRLKSGQHSQNFPMPKNRQPSPAAIAQAKQQISHVPGAAVALMGRGFDGSVESAEEVSALALTLEAKPALTQAEIEHRLSTQMITLDAMFYELAVRANGTAQLKPKVALVDLALKVQQSSRKAGLALNTIRNPRQPTQFIKNYVDRQLNQMITTPLPQTETHIPLPQSDRPNVEVLDTRATSSPTRADSNYGSRGNSPQGQRQRTARL